MAEVSSLATQSAFRKTGIVRELLGKAKREAIEDQLGKGESWCTKLLNNGAGVTIDDIELLADALGLKLVDKSKVCVNPKLAQAYEEIVRKATQERSLLFEDAE